LENKPKLKYISNQFSRKVEDFPVDKTYRIVITNNVFKKSRRLPISKQKDIAWKNGCEMPKALEATVLLVVTFMSSNKRLYNDNPLTYTRCSEEVADYPVVVGGFSPDGLSVSFHFDSNSNGVGGVLRKL
jgi:hypothetical protein